jgi:hypothetical protein
MGGAMGGVTMGMGGVHGVGSMWCGAMGCVAWCGVRWLVGVVAGGAHLGVDAADGRRHVRAISVGVLVWRGVPRPLARGARVDRRGGRDVECARAGGDGGLVARAPAVSGHVSK